MMRVPPAPHRALRCRQAAGSAGWWSLPRQSGSPGRPAAPAAGSIAVTGTGAARAVPDLMHFGVLVEVVRERAVDAMAQVGSSAEELVAAACSLGIDPQDIRAGEVCLEPDAVGGAPGEVVGGYRAAESFQMTVRRLEHAGPTLEAITGACGPGARITGIAFGVGRPEELRMAARREAYADACARAGYYALLAARRVGRLQSLDEVPAAPLYLPPGLGGVVGGPVPSPGTSDTVYEQVSVHAVFHLA